jgi:glycosyltransferase involved in cell wall biosynthesis
MGVSVTFLVDTDRPSYVEAAELYEEAFAALGLAVRTVDLAARGVSAGTWVLHHTIGPLFRPLPGAHNTAVVFHEWDRYPAAWVATLNAFQSIWAPSTHVADTLRASGVSVPIRSVPPPVAACRVPVKASWQASTPFRFLSIGEAHFRKGIHLLLDGFLHAFPTEGEATFTVKVSRGCTWRSPRGDITFVADRLHRDDLLDLYRTHDAYVSASLGEGLGLPVAEAVMAALPVVVNLWGGHCDLVQQSDCWPIAHDVVPQAFCSDPSYYAPGQRCAYSAPERIAAAMRAVAAASAGDREARARRAQASIDESHGTRRIAALVRQHHEAVLASRSDGFAHTPAR